MKTLDQLKEKYSIAEIERLCAMPKGTIRKGRTIPRKFLEKMDSLIDTPSVSPIKTIKASHKIDNHGILRSIGEDGKLYSYKPIPGDQFFQLNQG